MLVDSYQVEVQDLVTEVWKVDRCLQPCYKWRRATYHWPCILGGLFKRTRQEIVGDPSVQALIAKSDAIQHAQNIVCVKHPRPVRVTRIEREGARFVKFVIWLDGKWLE